MKKQIKYLMLLLVAICTVSIIDAHMHGGVGHGGRNFNHGMGRGGRGIHHPNNYGRGYNRRWYGGGGILAPAAVGFGLGAATAGLVGASYNRNYNDGYYDDSYNSDDRFTTYPHYGFSANNGNNPSYEY